MIIWRNGWRSNILVSQRFVAWLTPTLRAGLVGFPMSSDATRLPRVGRFKSSVGLNMIKVGPLAYCWWLSCPPDPDDPVRVWL